MQWRLDIVPLLTGIDLDLHDHAERYSDDDGHLLPLNDHGGQLYILRTHSYWDIQEVYRVSGSHILGLDSFHNCSLGDEAKRTSGTDKPPI